MAPSEQRKHARYAVDREVTVEIDGSRLHGRLADVSDGGAFVKLSIEVEVGADVLLALEDAEVRAPAEVKRLAPDGFAIRFDQETIGRIVGDTARGGGKGRR